MTEVRSQPTLGLPVIAAALAATVIWGLTPAVTKLAVGEVDPVSAGFLRTVIVGPFCLVVALFAKLQLPPSASGWGQLIGSALGCYIAFPVLFTFGQVDTTTSHAALIIAMMPISIGFFAATAERRMPSRGWWMGSGMAFCGVPILVGSRFGYAEPGVTLRGDLLCLASAISGFAGYIAGNRLTAVISTWGTTFWGLAFSGVLSTVVILVVPTPTDWSTVSTFGYATIAYLAIFGSILGYVAWYWALARGGAVRIGPIQFLLPVIALTVAVLGLGELLTVPLIISTVAIVGGIAVAQRS
jgi:drug/metabolite transporter (DMT)-like permease